MTITTRLTEAVRTALQDAELPQPDVFAWEPPRQPEHGDFATNVAMTLAKRARRPPRQVAELVAKHFPAIPEVDRIEIAGPGFVNVFLSATWSAATLKDILASGATYGRGDSHLGQRVRLEFVSANP